MPMTKPHPSDGVALEPDHVTDARRALECEAAKLDSVMPAACNEFDGDFDALETGWSESIEGDEIEVELTVTVRAKGRTAREALQELVASNVETKLLALGGLVGLCDLEEGAAA